MRTTTTLGTSNLWSLTKGCCCLEVPVCYKRLNLDYKFGGHSRQVVTNQRWWFDCLFCNLALAITICNMFCFALLLHFLELSNRIPPRKIMKTCFYDCE